jgi:glycosyltransferase involved in cell wall biosynthesis
MTAKKLMIFGSYAPSLVTFRGDFIAAAVASGHEVLAVAPNIDGWTSDEIRRLGASTAELRVENQSLNPLGIITAVRDLRRLIREHRPDVLLAYTIKPVVTGALAGSLEGVPRIVSVITGAGYAFTGGRELKRCISRLAANALYRMAFGRSDAIVFQNGDDEALFRRLGIVNSRQNVRRINGSGVNLSRFAIAPQPEAIGFLMIARLLKDKGVREYAAAARQLKKVHPEVAVRLAGYIDPSPDSITPVQVQEMIDGGIEFLGRLDDVRPAIANCSVYVLPSYREGTPRSVLEAMAMGRAIVTTDAPGCRETVVDGRNGFLVPARDWRGLHEAMSRFAEDPALAAEMGAESRKIAVDKYDVNRVNADLLEIAGL